MIQQGCFLTVKMLICVTLEKKENQAALSNVQNGVTSGPKTMVQDNGLQRWCKSTTSGSNDVVVLCFRPETHGSKASSMLFPQTMVSNLGVQKFSPIQHILFLL